MTEPHAIENIANYNDGMRRSLIDKIFFADKIQDADLIIDYGCADGSLIKFLAAIFPEQQFIGYDISTDMIQEAKKGNGHPNAVFEGNWDLINGAILKAQSQGKRVCVVLSSMIHEVYAYGAKQADEFWERIWAIGADYIAIRDMMVSRTTSRPADPLSVARVRQIFPSDLLAQWETQWGTIEENWSLVHFLLTYRYTANWDRELRENYLPLNLEDFMSLVPPTYSPTFIEHYTLPFLRGEIWRDFYIQLQDPTHFKAIYRKVKTPPRPLTVVRQH